MAPTWTSKVEVTSDLKIEDLRKACVDEKRDQTNLLMRERHAILKALYRAIKGKGKAYEFQGGLATQIDDNEAEWLAFVRKHGDLQTLSEIDIDFPPPPAPPKDTAPLSTAATAPGNAMPSSSTAALATAAAGAASSVQRAQQQGSAPTPMDVDTPSSSSAPAKPPPVSTTKSAALPSIASESGMAPPSAPSAQPLPSTSASNDTPAVASASSAEPSTSATPATATSAVPSPATLSSQASQQPQQQLAAPPTSSGSANSSPTAKPIEALAIAVPALSPSYAANLPVLPHEVFKAKFAHATRRKGKSEKLPTASGGPDLYKMQIKAQHTGIKNFIGRGKRVHNALSTHDWMVGLDEIRSLRAFERIDQLKNEKAWSFRQPKKLKTGFVNKAHWDHLLDEMRWLQTDFRQETRWKVAVAYYLAKAVKKWHKAGTPEARQALCVRTRPPETIDEQAVPSLESLKGELPAESPLAPVKPEDRRESMDVDAEGEEDTEMTDGNAPSKATTGADGSVDAKSRPVDLPPHVKQRLRQSYFDLSQSECLFGEEYLLDIDVDQVASLFPDLPRYADLTTPSDSNNDKRIDDSSYWAGRIANMTRLLEAKPWLVSTIEPAKLCGPRGWESSTYTALDDAKITGSLATDPPVPPPQGSLLFTPRKGREVPAAELIIAPPAVPNVEERAKSIYWSSEDDALLLSLQSRHGMNWSLIAHMFNHSGARPEMDFRLPWDMYDRWNRLVGPGSKEVLKDGTEIRIPLPTYVPPAQTLNNFEGSKKRLRHLAMFEAMRKAQKLREATAAKSSPPGPPRKLNMSMHESHLAQVGVFRSPMQWSAHKFEFDQNKARQRHEQQQLLLQHQRQQQAAAAAQAQLHQQQQAQQQAQQQQQQSAPPQQQQQLNASRGPGQSVSPQPQPQPNGASPAIRFAQPVVSGPTPAPSLSPQPNGVRYPQPVPQGFPIQQGRMSLPIHGPPTSSAAAAAVVAGRLVPSPSTPGVPGGPSSPLAAPPNGGPMLGASPRMAANVGLPTAGAGTPPPPPMNAARLPLVPGQPIPARPSSSSGTMQQQQQHGGGSSAHNTPQMAHATLNRPPSSSSLSAQHQSPQHQQQQQQQQQQSPVMMPVGLGGPGGAAISPEQLQLYHQRQQQLMAMQMQRAAAAQQQQQQQQRSPMQMHASPQQHPNQALQPAPPGSQQQQAGATGSPAMAGRSLGPT